MSRPRRPGGKGQAYAEVRWPDGRRLQAWVDADKVTPETPVACDRVASAIFAFAGVETAAPASAASPSVTPDVSRRAG